MKIKTELKKTHGRQPVIEGYRLLGRHPLAAIFSGRGMKDGCPPLPTRKPAGLATFPGCLPLWRRSRPTGEGVREGQAGRQASGLGNLLPVCWSCRFCEQEAVSWGKRTGCDILGKGLSWRRKGTLCCAEARKTKTQGGGKKFPASPEPPLPSLRRGSEEKPI